MRRPLSLPPLPGDTEARVTAVSGDGSTAVGVSGSSPNERAFYWTEATGVVELPGANAFAWEVNYDGSVIVGTSLNPPDPRLPFEVAVPLRTICNESRPSV